MKNLQTNKSYFISVFVIASTQTEGTIPFFRCCTKNIHKRTLPANINSFYSAFVRVRVVLKRTVAGD